MNCMKPCLFHFKNGKNPILLKKNYPNFCITAQFLFYFFLLFEYINFSLQMYYLLLFLA